MGAHKRHPLPFVLAGLLVAGTLLTGPELGARKLVGTLIMPVGLLWLALIAAMARQLWLERDVRWLAAAFLAFTLAGNTWVGGAMLRWLEAPYRVMQSEPLEVVLVLGGGTIPGPGGVGLSAAGDRVITAVRQYRLGRSPKLVTIGTSVAGLQQEGPRDLAEETSTIWRALGVPESAIIKAQGARTTGEELKVFAKMVRERGWTRIGILTSAWHLRRAMAHARAEGLECTPVPGDFRGFPAVYGVLGLVPSGNGFYKVRLAAWELVGWLLTAR